MFYKRVNKDRVLLGESCLHSNFQRSARVKAFHIEPPPVSIKHFAETALKPGDYRLVITMTHGGKLEVVNM